MVKLAVFVPAVAVLKATEIVHHEPAARLVQVLATMRNEPASGPPMAAVRRPVVASPLFANVSVRLALSVPTMAAKGADSGATARTGGRCSAAARPAVATEATVVATMSPPVSVSGPGV